MISYVVCVYKEFVRNTEIYVYLACELSSWNLLATQKNSGLSLSARWLETAFSFFAPDGLKTR